VTIYGIPASLTQPGDAHILTVHAQSSSGNSYRVSEQYYRDAVDRFASLGVALSAPTVTTIVSTPTLRLSTSLPSQADYPSFANATHSQPGRVVSVTGTAPYFGATPSTWVLDVPDLSAVSGFSTSYGLQSGASTTSYAEGYSGTLATFFGALTEGGSLKFAGRLSGAPLAQLSVTGAARDIHRSRFAPGRAIVRR
jgi:hypothetical protein